MNQEVKIAPCTLEDAKVISGWRYEGVYRVYNYPTWESMVEQRWGITVKTVREKEFFVVWRGNQRLGYFRLHDQEDDVVLGLGIEPKRCGRGYGKSFLEEIISYVKFHKKCSTIRLFVREFNERAIRCYQNVGFDIVGKVRKNTMVGEDCFFEMIYRMEEI